MPSENSDQSGSSDQMIQKNQSYIISVSPEKSDLHLFFLLYKKYLQKEEFHYFSIITTLLTQAQFLLKQEFHQLVL